MSARYARAGERGRARSAAARRSEVYEGGAKGGVAGTPQTPQAFSSTYRRLTSTLDATVGTPVMFWR